MLLCGTPEHERALLPADDQAPGEGDTFTPLDVAQGVFGGFASFEVHGLQPELELSTLSEPGGSRSGGWHRKCWHRESQCPPMSSFTRKRGTSEQEICEGDRNVATARLSSGELEVFSRRRRDGRVLGSGPQDRGPSEGQDAAAPPRHDSIIDPGGTMRSASATSRAIVAFALLTALAGCRSRPDSGPEPRQRPGSRPGPRWTRHDLPHLRMPGEGFRRQVPGEQVHGRAGGRDLRLRQLREGLHRGGSSLERLEEWRRLHRTALILPSRRTFSAARSSPGAARVAAGNDLRCRASTPPSRLVARGGTWSDSRRLHDYN